MPLLISLVAASALAGSPSHAPAEGRLTDVAPPGNHFKLIPEAHKNADTFKLGQPIVGTTYFYWYDVYSGEHIWDDDGTDALTTHPPRDAMADLSYRSPRWHYQQLRDIREAGIDFILPVFWGTPGQHGQWSFVGLGPLIAAHDRMMLEHNRNSGQPAAPRIGMFYDTSTLRHHRLRGLGRHAGIDLTTDRGRDWFYVTIRDFFSLIPPVKWARIDGKPIMFLYGAEFAAAVDDKLFDDTRRRFKADFGADLFLVRHSDWPGRADAWYQWGGSMGLTVGDHVAGLGPGYDHSAVPGRQPHVVSRQGGSFYKRQWELLLRMAPQRRPWIVHVETWNEWHEGTDIARSEQWNDQYLQLTAQYARQFRAGLRLERSGPFVSARRVRWSAQAVGGLTLLPSKGDGCWERCVVDGQHAVVTVPSPEGVSGRYLYFDIDDSYCYDEIDRTAEVTVVFLDDGGCRRFRIDYDNRDPTAGPRAGAFRPSQAIQVGDTDTWRIVKLQLPDVRFANRAHRADLRLAVIGGDQRLTVREIIVRRLPGELAHCKDHAGDTQQTEARRSSSSPNSSKAVANWRFSISTTCPRPSWSVMAHATPKCFVSRAGRQRFGPV